MHVVEIKYLKRARTWISEAGGFDENSVDLLAVARLLVQLVQNLDQVAANSAANASCRKQTRQERPQRPDSRAPTTPRLAPLFISTICSFS